MLSLKPLTNAHQASVYYEKDDYYVDGHTVAPSSWWGVGARRLGLSGPVDREVFRELLEGKLPNGVVLERGAGRMHRPGIDLTFSAPKSVSLMALVGDDDRITVAHEAAVTAALDYLQRSAPRARNAMGGVDRLEKTNNLVVARFLHDTSRALDPQLHTHAVVLNVTRRSDGAWRALSNEEVFRSKMIGGAIYRAELARRLRGLGYETMRTHADGRFELAGISQEQLSSFSRRRKAIVEHLEARGLDSHPAADAAARATREKKQEVDRDALRQEWKNQAHQMQLDLHQLRGPVYRQAAGDTRSLADRSVDRALERLTERNVVVSEKRLLVAALNLSVGEVKLEDVKRAIDRKLEAKALVPATPLRRRDPFEQHFTTDKQLATEQALLQLVDRAREQVKPLATARAVNRALNTIQHHSAHRLSKGQVQAIGLTLTTTDRVVGIQGYAGTGKTTGALLHIRRYAERAGLEVKGLAPTAAAADVLSKDAGIEAMTIARFLTSEKRPKKKAKTKKPELWIVDESSMLSNAQARELLAHAERTGARVVLVGDRDQLPSIEAGRAFALLQDRGMQVAKLETVVRQKDDALMLAVDRTIARDHDKALDAIGPRVKQIEQRFDRLVALSTEYVKLPEKERDAALIVTPSNVDRVALNRIIRSMLSSEKALGEDHAARVLIARDLTADERKDALHYQEGDVVRFGRRYKSVGVERGDTLTIANVDAGAGTVTLLDAEGRTKTWRPSRASNVEIYEVSRRALAAGDRIRFTKNDRSLGRHNGQLGRVVAIDPERGIAEVLSAGKTHHLHLDAPQHIEHAYVSTIHAAQGRTTDRVFIQLDTKQSHMIGHEAWYVALSRARKDVRIYTDDKSKLPAIIQQSLQQEAALDVAQEQRPKLHQRVPSKPPRDQAPKLELEKKPKHEMQHELQRGYGYGMGFSR